MEEWDRNRLLMRLEALGEPSLAAFSAALMPGMGRPLLGVRIPKLRALAKEMVRGDWRGALAGALTTGTFEEVLLRGFILGYARMEWAERRERIAAFEPLIDNWAVCDCCCASFIAVRRHLDEAWPAMRERLRSTEEFRQRFAAVMLMDHFLTADYAVRVLDELARLRPAGHYALMGAAWAVQACLVKHPAPTLDRLRRRAFPEEIQRQACRKMLESRRTPDALRAEIRELGKGGAPTP